MDVIGSSTWLWVGFSLFILCMLGLDLGLFNRKAHTVRYREAWIWSGVWVTLAMLFASLVFRHQGSQRGLEFLTGYLIELSLSVDNLFVFLLVYTGLKMFKQEESDLQPEQNPVVRIVTRYFPITREYENKHFFTKVNGRHAGTLLLLVLIVVEVTDLVFAVDSIPAIFAITTDTFIVYTSNVFAILGLRSMYFLLAGVVEKFRYLRTGLAIVLTFIGAKMLLVAVGVHIHIWISLVLVALVLLGSVAASLLITEDSKTTIDVDLPDDFDLPLTEDPPMTLEDIEHPESQEEEPQSVEQRR